MSTLNEYTKRWKYESFYFLLVVPTFILAGFVSWTLDEDIFTASYKGLVAAGIYILFSYFLIWAGGQRYRHPDNEKLLVALLSEKSYPFYIKKVMVGIAIVTAILQTVI